MFNDFDQFARGLFEDRPSLLERARREFQAHTLIDPDSRVFEVEKLVSTCSNPDCEKQDGILLFVPGERVLDYQYARAGFDPDDRTSIWDRVGIPLLMTVVNQHDGNYATLTLTRDDARFLVNRLSEAIAHADRLNARREASRS